MVDEKDEVKDEESCEEPQAAEKPEEGVEAGALSDGYESHDVFENAEPWDPIETKIVVGSFIAAAVFLVIFGILINIFLLG